MTPPPRRQPRPSPSPAAICAGALLDAAAALLDYAAALSSTPPAGADLDAARRQLDDAARVLAGALDNEGGAVALTLDALASSPAGGAAGWGLDLLPFGPARVRPELPISLDALACAIMDAHPGVFLVERGGSGPAAVIAEVDAPGAPGGVVELAFELAINVTTPGRPGLLATVPITVPTLDDARGASGPADLQPGVCDAPDASAPPSPFGALGAALRGVINARPEWGASFQGEAG